MYNYSIMPLDTAHLEEICLDIERQYDEGIATLALFMMPLVPEGDPATDKAGLFCQAYDLFRDRLARDGYECGILAQCTIGHGYPLKYPSSFQSFTDLAGGERANVVCPLDEGFRAHFFDQFATLAAHRPKVIIVDDDFRLIDRKGCGCGCPLHIKRVGEIVGRELTREQIRDGLFTDEALHDAYVQSQREALLGAAQVFRAGIDSVDPTIQGAFCICSGQENVGFGLEIGKILAGKGNKTIIRIHNARYTADGARGISSQFWRAANDISMMREADVLLAETDTCPQNRYSTSASTLHALFTGSILEGASGAKHWITRLSSHEPKAGEAYRRVLGRHSGFYNTLSDLVPRLVRRGFRITVRDKETFLPPPDDLIPNGWLGCVLERLGLPVYFAHGGGVLCLDGSDDAIYTDEEMLDALSGNMILSSEAAERLSKRGFCEYIGVEVREWTGALPSFERVCSTGRSCTCQMGIRQLIPHPDATVSSTVFHQPDGRPAEALFPGTSVYRNRLGGRVITFCGTPKAAFVYNQAFSFLCEARKEQLIELLTLCGENPVHYLGDAEVYLAAADIEGENDSLLCAFFNIGLDVLDQIELGTERKVRQVLKLTSEGVFAEVGFVSNSEGGITVDSPAGILDPVILKLIFNP